MAIRATLWNYGPMADGLWLSGRLGETSAITRKTKTWDPQASTPMRKLCMTTIMISEQSKNVEETARWIICWRLDTQINICLKALVECSNTLCVTCSWIVRRMLRHKNVLYPMTEKMQTVNWLNEVTCGNWLWDGDSLMERSLNAFFNKT